MNTQSMTNVHQNSAPWLWPLGQGEATRFEAAGHARWLLVAEGRVWLTRSGAGRDEGADVWLEAGQRHLLPAGTEWVAEGWPQARVELAEAPAPRLSVGAAARWRVWPPPLRAA